MPDTLLRDMRTAHGLTLREMAHRSGVDPSQLSRAERGLEGPSPRLVLAVARTLGLRDVIRVMEMFWGGD